MLSSGWTAASCHKHADLKTGEHNMSSLSVSINMNINKMNDYKVCLLSWLVKSGIEEEETLWIQLYILVLYCCRRKVQEKLRHFYCCSFLPRLLVNWRSINMLLSGPLSWIRSDCPQVLVWLSLFFIYKPCWRLLLNSIPASAHYNDNKATESSFACHLCLDFKEQQQQPKLQVLRVKWKTDSSSNYLCQLKAKLIRVSLTILNKSLNSPMN